MYTDFNVHTLTIKKINKTQKKKEDIVTNVYKPQSH
jgi:hypothetical protein